MNFESHQQIRPVSGAAIRKDLISIPELSRNSVFMSCLNVDPIDFRIAKCFLLATVRAEIELYTFNRQIADAMVVNITSMILIRYAMISLYSAPPVLASISVHLRLCLPAVLMKQKDY